jgi:hypothetical protein
MYTHKTCARIYTPYRPPALQLTGTQIIDFKMIRQSVKCSCITYFNTGIPFHYFHIPCGYHGTYHSILVFFTIIWYRTTFFSSTVIGGSFLYLDTYRKIYHNLHRWFIFSSYYVTEYYHLSYTIILMSPILNQKTILLPNM